MDNYLKLEGSERYECLNYLVISRSDLDLAWMELKSLLDAPIYELTKLYDEDWPFGIILVETSVDKKELFLVQYLKAMNLLMESKFIRCSICMFDGSFGGYQDLLSEEYSSHIYSVWFSGEYLNIAAADSLRNSDDWKLFITKSKLKMYESFGID